MGHSELPDLISAQNHELQPQQRHYMAKRTMHVFKYFLRKYYKVWPNGHMTTWSKHAKTVTNSNKWSTYITTFDKAKIRTGHVAKK